MKLKTLIGDAFENKYAIGAFNFYNLESALAIVQASLRKEQPVIMMVTETSIEYAGLDNLCSIFQNEKSRSGANIYLHLDHGKDVELIKECIDLKFDSVMFDGSSLAFEQNVTISSELRKYAHKKGVLFEAEIGRVGGTEDNISSELFKTNPQEALNFYQQAKPDLLAVAIGNIHGYKTASEQLDLSLLAKIQDTLKGPLVLHGCSNRENREYAIAIGEGIVKINIDTELREAFIDGASKAFRSKEKDPRKFLASSLTEMQKRVETKIDVFSKSCC